MRIVRMLVTTFAVCLCAEVVLTNDTVLKLVRAGIGEDSILGMVNEQPGIYALSTDDLVALKKAGVTPKILAAMLVRNGAPDVAVIQPVPDAGNSLRVNRDLTALQQRPRTAHQRSKKMEIGGGANCRASASTGLPCGFSFATSDHRNLLS